MFTIGDFAAYGRVSIRMLRHYDAVGLLRPARVDPSNGYRFYEAAQLADLNRLVALKDLGFTLEQVRVILEDKVTGEELRGMLRLRRAQLEERIEADLARLTGVEARLRTIESEQIMPVQEVMIKQVPPSRVAALTATAAGFDPVHISPVIQPLYHSLCERITEAGLEITGPAIAWYEHGEGDSIVVHAGMGFSGGGTGDFEVVDLPGFEAATLIHHGPMEEIMPSEQALARWLDDHGRKATGLAREFYLDCPPDQADWVTELQVPLSTL